MWGLTILIWPNDSFDTLSHRLFNSILLFMYFYYKNKYENKSKDNEYLPKNFNFKKFRKISLKTFVGARERL